MVTIYTDGSARGNPGPGGWGAIIISDTEVKEIGGSDEHTTNNKMELTAAIRALENMPGDMVTIYTDSEYVMKGITSWIHGWQAKGWRTAAKKPVLNKELWQELLAQTEGKNISWKYVQGHSGDKYNDRCDEIATKFADGEDANLYEGPRALYK